MDLQKWLRYSEAKKERIRELNNRNSQIVLDYLRYKESQNLSHHRLARILDFMFALVNYWKKDFDKLSQEDLEAIAIWINQSNWKGWTKYTYTNIFKNFVKWLMKNFDLKLELDAIKSKKPKDRLMPEYLITEEEFNRLFNGADDLQTKLLIGLLYESGCRIGEILSLKIQNVSFNQYGAKLIVTGKTGQRVIPIIWFAKLLKQFIESHPLKENPEAPLWFIKRGNEIRILRYDAFRLRLKRLCEKVGIRKRIHPHLFRHSRLTELAKQLPEQILKQMAGWTNDSKMAKTYIHLSQKDIEANVLEKVYGIKIKENEKSLSKVCPKCGELNPLKAKICWRCATDLDEKILKERILSEEELKKLNEWCEVLIEFFKIIEKENPKVWNKLKMVLKEKGKEDLINL